MGHLHRDCPTNPYVPSRKSKQSFIRKHSVKKAECHVFDDDDDKDVNDDDDFVLMALYGARVLSSNNTWIIDSGATKHMSPFLDMFVDYVPFRVNELVSLGNGTNCEALGIGRIPVHVLCDGVPRRRILADVLYVPKLVNNFFSVTAATLKGFITVKFERERCVVLRDNTVIVLVIVSITCGIWTVCHMMFVRI